MSGQCRMISTSETRHAPEQRRTTHFDDYDEHIKVIEVAGYYIPRTDKGRKTIEKCGLLRFAYKYANYGGTSQENKETILTLANCLLDANTPADEHAF